MIFNNKLLLYIALPINDFCNAIINEVLFIIGLINEIIANAIYIITKDCSNPYTTPPSLSHCFITGNLVIKFAKPLINNRIILLTINKPIATAILIIIIATFLAVDSTIAVFASFPDFSSD